LGIRESEGNENGDKKIKKRKKPRIADKSKKKD